MRSILRDFAFDLTFSHKILNILREGGRGERQTGGRQGGRGGRDVGREAGN